MLNHDLGCNPYLTNWMDLQSFCYQIRDCGTFASTLSHWTLVNCFTTEIQTGAVLTGPSDLFTLLPRFTTAVVLFVGMISGSHLPLACHLSWHAVFQWLWLLYDSGMPPISGCRRRWVTCRQSWIDKIPWVQRSSLTSPDTVST